MVHAWICATCGVQYPPGAQPPEHCPICRDARQYLPPTGQEWTTMAALQRLHCNSFRQHEPGLLGIGSVPRVAIGQRALLVQTPEGNVLWDCISLLDAATETLIRGLGGIAAIAISHPHYYASMVDWSRSFAAPVYLHAADRAWVMRPDPALVFWEGDSHALLPGLTLLRPGGHFAGGAVLHWDHEDGVLLGGDVLATAADRAHVTFMRSYPNFIPLARPVVERMARCMAPWRFDRLYGPFFESLIPSGAKAALARSVARYLAALDEDPDV